MNKSEQILRIDEKDKAILNILSDNAKLSFRQIAKKLNISSVTVMNRVRKLESEGIIKKYSTVINYDKLGYDLPVIVDIRVSKGKLKKVEKKIAIHPNVISVFDNTGNFDATIIARFKNRRGLDTFIKKIQSFEDVERTETKLILKTVKREELKF